MRLIYVDESYCKACYYVVALLVPESDVRSLSDALDQVVQDTSCGFEGVAAEAELHGYDPIADEPGQADQQPEYRGNLRAFQQVGTRGYRSRQLTRIVDTIYFAPSTASRLVQAVDLIAFLYHRIQTEVNTDPRAVKANNALWARIAPKVVHAHCWVP